jgi:NAD(P)H-dependent FMN reductase
MLKVGLIVGSTRPNRFADIPVRWLLQGAQERRDFEIEVLDLRDVGLPLFAEPRIPAMAQGVFLEPKAEAWRHRIGACDAFIATVAEYNHGPTAVLKNAFDSAYLEWQRKPIAFVGYGGVGGARAIEQLRGVAVGLQMAPMRFDVNIAQETFFAALARAKSLDDFDDLKRSRTVLFDHLVWWGEALSLARAERIAA